jgi:hypothetical protein
MELLVNIFKLIETVFYIIVLFLVCYSFWHGSYYKSGNIEIELYGIGRYFQGK